MPHLTLWQIELIPWYAFAVVWLIGAVKLKSTKATESDAARLYTSAVLILAGVLLFERGWHLGILGTRIFPWTAVAGCCGLALTFAGAAIAIWARINLGSNWSARITLKLDHELIRSGPYKYVRHPIYTGMITALLGTAVVVDEWRGLLGMALAIVGLSFKAQREEKFMQSEFGESYQEYRRRTGFLVPGL